MIKNNERIFQLHSLLSKLLDSLCFQLAVNKVDDNSLSLLEILMWKKNGEVDDEELLQLYKSWLQSKCVFDLFACRQVETYPKNQLIMNELVRNSFMNVAQINKSLELLNQLYNKLYSQHKPKNIQYMDKMERIFSYLDSQGNIHLRISELFFLLGSMMMAERYTIPLNYESFKLHLDELRKDMCEIDGMVSLRAFKNYFFRLNQTKRNLFLDGLIPVFLDFDKYSIGQKGELPNLIEEAIIRWKSYPRFTSNHHESKKKIEIYKRLFEQNEVLFYDDNLIFDCLVEKYGREFLECLEIDNSIIRQFTMVLRETMNKYVELFGKMSSMTHRSSHSNRKLQAQHGSTQQSRPSNKDRTPLKQHAKKNSTLRTKTPTKKEVDVQIRQQFGSTERSKSRTIGRQTTPTKSHRSQNLYQSSAYTNQRVGIKNGVEKNSIYNNMGYFRNKRVESYQIVMKRLKGR